jgi:hypothetical protein
MARSPTIARLTCASLGTILVLSGCGSDSTTATTTTPQSTLESAANQFAEITCAALANCQCMDAAAVADCGTAYAEYFKLMMSDLLVEAPAVKLDQARFDACMAEFETAISACPTRMDFAKLPSCAGPSGEGPSFFVGTQTEGEWCDDSAFCVEGLGCDELLKTCQPKIAAGGSCATVECQAGLYCNSSHVCAQQAVAGDACNPADRHQCTTGLTCVGAAPACTAPHALGDDCTDGAGCVPGAYCATTCTALKAGGAVCASDDECISDECNGSSGVCDPASFCALRMLRM